MNTKASRDVDACCLHKLNDGQETIVDHLVGILTVGLLVGSGTCNQKWPSSSGP